MDNFMRAIKQFDTAMGAAEHYQNMLRTVIDMCIGTDDDTPEVAAHKRSIIEFLHSAFQDRKRVN